MSDIKKLLEMRRKLRNKRPKFRRQGYGIYPRINDKWRRPRGRHSKQRHQMAGHAKKVKPGFRTNKIVRGIHNSGLIPVVIHTVAHIPLLKKDIHGAIIGKSVGNRKKLTILNELKKHGIKVINLPDNYEQKIQEKLKLRQQIKEDKSKKKDKKAKKEEKKEEKQMTEEEKAAQEKKEKDKLLTKEQK